MNTAAALTFQLITIHNLSPADNGQLITLADGKKLTVSEKTAGYATIAPALTLAFQKKKPVGVVVDADSNITAALIAQNAVVESIAADRHNPGVEVVSFARMAGRYRLLAADENVAQLRKTLKESQADAKPVWFVNDPRAGKLVAAAPAK